MTRFMALWICVLLAVQPALAEAPLPPGKPAGLRPAQALSNRSVYVGAIVLLGVGIGLALSPYDNPVSTAPTQPKPASSQ